MLELIKAKLIDDGYTGLYYDGECACEIDDLAPCGECNQDNGEEFINGCSPGYKFVDSENPNFCLVMRENTEPTDDQWDYARRNYL